MIRAFGRGSREGGASDCGTSLDFAQQVIGPRLTGPGSSRRSSRRFLQGVATVAPVCDVLSAGRNPSTACSSIRRPIMRRSTRGGVAPHGRVEPESTRFVAADATDALAARPRTFGGAFEACPVTSTEHRPAFPLTTRDNFAWSESRSLPMVRATNTKNNRSLNARLARASESRRGSS